MSFSRRTLLAGIAAAPFVLRAQEGPLRARVKIDTERVIGDIDPMIYGNFIEHLGRCIDGGVFEENSPLSDPNGFRRDVLDAAKKLNVTNLRWPGGNFSSNYHWRDGIGPRDQASAAPRNGLGHRGKQPLRHPRVSRLRGEVGHHALHLLQSRHRNLGEAQQWVEYCNSSEDTAMTRLRKQNGRAGALESTHTGASATKWTAPGRWATAAPTTTASSPSKPPS